MDKQENKLRRMAARLVSTRRRKIVMIIVVSWMLVVLYRIYEILQFVIKLKKNPLELSVHFIEVDDRNSSICKLVLFVPNTALPMEVKFGTMSGEVLSIGNDVKRLFRFDVDKIVIQKKQDINDIELFLKFWEFDLLNVVDSLSDKRILLTEYMFMVYTRFCFVPLYFNVTKLHVFNDKNTDDGGEGLKKIMRLLNMGIYNDKRNSNGLVFRVDVDRKQVSHMLADLSPYLSICNVDIRFSQIIIHTDIECLRQVYIVSNSYEEKDERYFGFQLMFYIDDKEICDFLARFSKNKSSFGIIGLSYKEKTYILRRKLYLYNNKEKWNFEKEDSKNLKSELKLDKLNSKIFNSFKSEELNKNSEIRKEIERLMELYKQRMEMNIPELNIESLLDDIVINTIRMKNEKILRLVVGISADSPIACNLWIVKKCLHDLSFTIRFLLPGGDIARLKFGLCEPDMNILCKELKYGFFAKHNSAILYRKNNCKFEGILYLELVQMDIKMLLLIKEYGIIFIKIDEEFGRFQIFKRNVFIYTLENLRLCFMLLNDCYTLFEKIGKEEKIENTTVIEFKHIINGWGMKYIITSESNKVHDKKDCFCFECDEMVALGLNSKRLNAYICFNGSGIWYNRTTGTWDYMVYIKTIIQFKDKACMRLRSEDLWEYFEGTALLNVYGFNRINSIRLFDLYGLFSQIIYIEEFKKVVQCKDLSDLMWWNNLYRFEGFDEMGKIWKSLNRHINRNVVKKGDFDVQILPVALRIESLEGPDSIHCVFTGASPNSNKTISDNIDETNNIIIRLKKIMNKLKGIEIPRYYKFIVRNSLLLPSTLFNIVTDPEDIIGHKKMNKNFYKFNNYIKSNNRRNYVDKIVQFDKDGIRNVKKGNFTLLDNLALFLNENFIPKGLQKDSFSNLAIVSDKLIDSNMPSISIIVQPLQIHFDLYDNTGYIYLSSRTKVQLLIAYHVLFCIKSLENIWFSDSPGMLETTIGLYCNNILHNKKKIYTFNKKYGTESILARSNISVIKKSSATIVSGLVDLSDSGHTLQLCEFLAVENIDYFMISVIAIDASNSNTIPFYSLTAGIVVNNITNNINNNKSKYKRIYSENYGINNLYCQEKCKKMNSVQMPQSYKKNIKDIIIVSKDEYIVEIINGYVNVKTKINMNDYKIDSKLNFDTYESNTFTQNKILQYDLIRYTYECFFPLCKLCSILWGAEYTSDIVKIWVWQVLRLCTICSSCPQCGSLLNAWDLWMCDGILVASCSFCKIWRPRKDVPTNLQLYFEGVFCDTKLFDLGTVFTLKENIETAIVIHFNDDSSAINYSGNCLFNIKKKNSLFEKLLILFKKINNSTKMTVSNEKLQNTDKSKAVENIEISEKSRFKKFLNFLNFFGFFKNSYFKNNKIENDVDKKILSELLNDIQEYCANIITLNIEIEDIITKNNMLVPHITLTNRILDHLIHDFLKWFCYFSPFTNLVPKEIEFECLIQIPRVFLLKIQNSCDIRLEEAQIAISQRFIIQDNQILNINQSTKNPFFTLERDPYYTVKLLNAVGIDRHVSKSQQIFVGNNRQLYYGNTIQDLKILPDSKYINSKLKNYKVIKKAAKRINDNLQFNVEKNYKTMSYDSNIDNVFLSSNLLSDLNSKDLNKQIIKLKTKSVDANLSSINKYELSTLNNNSDDVFYDLSSYYSVEENKEEELSSYYSAEENKEEELSSYYSAEENKEEELSSYYSVEENEKNHYTSKNNKSNSNDYKISTVSENNKKNKEDINKEDIKIDNEIFKVNDKTNESGKTIFNIKKLFFQLSKSFIVLIHECFKLIYNLKDLVIKRQKTILSKENNELIGNIDYIGLSINIFYFIKEFGNIVFNNFLNGNFCGLKNTKIFFNWFETDDKMIYQLIKTIVFITMNVIGRNSNKSFLDSTCNISSKKGISLANGCRYRDNFVFDMCSPGFISYYNMMQITTNEKISLKDLHICTECLRNNSNGLFKDVNIDIVIAYDIISQIQYRNIDVINDKDSNLRSMFSSLIEYYKNTDINFYNSLLKCCKCQNETNDKTNNNSYFTKKANKNIKTNKNNEKKKNKKFDYLKNNSILQNNLFRKFNEFYNIITKTWNNMYTLVNNSFLGITLFYDFLTGKHWVRIKGEIIYVKDDIEANILLSQYEEESSWDKNINTEISNYNINDYICENKNRINKYIFENLVKNENCYVKLCNCTFDIIFKKYFNSKYFENQDVFIYHPHCNLHCTIKKTKENICLCRFVPSIYNKKVSSYNSMIINSLQDLTNNSNNNLLKNDCEKYKVLNLCEKVFDNVYKKDNLENNILQFTKITKNLTHLYAFLSIMNLKTLIINENKEEFYYLFDLYGNNKRILLSNYEENILNSNQIKNIFNNSIFTKIELNNKFENIENKINFEKNIDQKIINLKNLNINIENKINFEKNINEINKKSDYIRTISNISDYFSENDENYKIDNDIFINLDNKIINTFEINNININFIKELSKELDILNYNNSILELNNNEIKNSNFNNLFKELNNDVIPFIKISIIFESRIYFYERACPIQNNLIIDDFTSIIFKRDTAFYKNETLYQHFLWPNVFEINHNLFKKNFNNPVELETNINNVEMWCCGFNLIHLFNNEVPSFDSLANMFVLRYVGSLNYIIDFHLPFSLVFKNNSSLTLSCLISNSLMATIILNGHCTDPNMFVNGFTISIPLQIDSIELDIDKNSNILDIDQVYFNIDKQNNDYYISFNIFAHLLDKTNILYKILIESNEWLEKLNNLNFYILDKNYNDIFPIYTNILDFYHKNDFKIIKDKNILNSKVFLDYYFEKFSDIHIHRINNTLGKGGINPFFKNISKKTQYVCPQINKNELIFLVRKVSLINSWFQIINNYLKYLQEFKKKLKFDELSIIFENLKNNLAKKNFFFFVDSINFNIRFYINQFNVFSQTLVNWIMSFIDNNCQILSSFLKYIFKKRLN